MTEQLIIVMRVNLAIIVTKHYIIIFNVCYCPKIFMGVLSIKTDNSRVCFQLTLCI